MGRITSIAAKDLRLLVRDRGGLFFVVVFPLLYAVFFGFISSAMMGGGGGLGKIKILVVDEDQTESSAKFAAALAGAEELDVATEPSRDAAAAKVRAGDRVAFVAITKGWGEASGRMFWGDPPRVEIGCDPSRGVEKGVLQGLLMEHGAARFQDMFTNSASMRQNAREALASMDADADMSPTVAAPLRLLLGSLDSLSSALEAQGAADGLSGEGGPSFEPVRVEQVPIERDPGRGAPNAFAISFPQAIVWGLMGAAAGFGISLVTERTKGTMTRLRTAPISSRDILAGKALACWLTAISVCVLMLAIGMLGFKVRPQSWALLACGVFSASVCFTGIMMLLSVIGRTEQAAGGIGWAALIVMAMIGGGMIPLFVLEQVPLMSTLSHLSPVKWAIFAIEGGLWRGLSFARLAPSFGVLLAIGAGGLLGGSWLFPRLERH